MKDVPYNAKAELNNCRASTGWNSSEYEPYFEEAMECIQLHDDGTVSANPAIAPKLAETHHAVTPAMLDAERGIAQVHRAQVHHVLPFDILQFALR